MTKETIQEKANKGSFLCEHDGYKVFADLNGSEAKIFLESHGFKVIKNYDTGRNGLAVTECGIHLSTNGWLYKK